MENKTTFTQQDNLGSIQIMKHDNNKLYKFIEDIFSTMDEVIEDFFDNNQIIWEE